MESDMANAAVAQPATTTTTTTSSTSTPHGRELGIRGLWLLRHDDEAANAAALAGEQAGNAEHHNSVAVLFSRYEYPELARERAALCT